MYFVVMSGTISSSAICNDRESRPLLSPTSGTARPSSNHRRTRHHPFLRHICLSSKPAIALICLSVVIGALHTIYTCLFVYVTFMIGNQHDTESTTIVITYLAMTIAVFLYPLSGFFADIVCGRYRLMVVSMGFVIFSFIIFLCVVLLVLLNHGAILFDFSRVSDILFIILVALFGIFFGIGLITYYANFVQFGLDQLMEAPSRYLSLFVHWVMWADSVGSVIVIPLAASIVCHNKALTGISSSVPLIFFVCLIALLMFFRRKRNWFYTESGLHNPYKTVIKVLNFARKHKYPLQSSAFTYSDDERPSRLDFCKQRFGGPFTTEQVEDVKTFIRILIVLFAVGPIFVLNVSSSSFGLPIINAHITHRFNDFCDARWIFIESGTLRYAISAVVFPMYMYFIFVCMKRKQPNMFTRLQLGMLLYLLGVTCILVSDVLAHKFLKRESQSNSTSECVFAISLDLKKLELRIPTLGLHWASLIPANVLLGVGPLIVITTALEFISAQSPHSMKGLIVGLFFTIKSLFQLLGSFAVIPFSLKDIWESESMIERPPVTNCGFGYLLFVCSVAFVGFVSLVVAARMYKYRERDDRPYDYQYVEDAYLRYFQQRLIQ